MTTSSTQKTALSPSPVLALYSPFSWNVFGTRCKASKLLKQRQRGPDADFLQTGISAKVDGWRDAFSSICRMKFREMEKENWKVNDEEKVGTEPGNWCMRGEESIKIGLEGFN